MTEQSIISTKNFNETAYKKLGILAQRKYPNEELCRFMGRNFFHKNLDTATLKKVKVLETGCGSGSNLWMLAKEGFDVYGIDLSTEAISLATNMLDNYGVSANLSVQDMTQLSFKDEYFDIVIDVFSSCVLTKDQRLKYLSNVYNILKNEGIFFSYFPSKLSDLYTYPDQSVFLDSDTLNCITRKGAPYSPTPHPFSFMHPQEYENLLRELGFEVTYLETIQRTYNRQKEIFSHIVIEAKKKI